MLHGKTLYGRQGEQPTGKAAAKLRCTDTKDALAREGIDKGIYTQGMSDKDFRKRTRERKYDILRKRPRIRSTGIVKG